ncbi:MAG: hypothetical protein AUH42_02140 [Gemmatimonadetes bacterium 13_1_40CM_70_11]|nr:MAG: hypothetical protein AUH42_02140 [Gemmatimonadetes bacterium 13_1_40CM_70_11]
MRTRISLLLTAALAVTACVPYGYTRAEIVYGEPAEYVYITPVERVVVVTREVLVSRGWVVYRIERDGPNRVIWARRGDDDVVRVFATPAGGGERVVVRTIAESRERGDRGRHRGWARHDAPRDVITDIDVRLRAH